MHGTLLAISYLVVESWLAGGGGWISQLSRFALRRIKIWFDFMLVEEDWFIFCHEAGVLEVE